jgi:hypothetical protein
MQKFMGGEHVLNRLGMALNQVFIRCHITDSKYVKGNVELELRFANKLPINLHLPEQRLL